MRIPSVDTSIKLLTILCIMIILTPLFQVRPAQSSNQVRYTGITTKIVHNIPSSISLRCLNLVTIALIIRRPNCTQVLDSYLGCRLLHWEHFNPFRWMAIAESSLVPLLELLLSVDSQRELA